MKKIISFVRKYKVSIAACVLVAVLGIGVYFVMGQPTMTSIGSNIHVIGNLTTGGDTTISGNLTVADRKINVIGDFGGKSGPTSLLSAGRNVWDKGYGVGGSVDATTYNYGIHINETGTYEVKAGQRTAAGGPYINVTLNGDRTTLENRANGIWSHDHAAGANQWTWSIYIGTLNAGEIISAGGPNTTNLSYGASGFVGFLIVKRIK